MRILKNRRVYLELYETFRFEGVTLRCESKTYGDRTGQVCYFAVDGECCDEYTLACSASKRVDKTPVIFVEV